MSNGNGRADGREIFKKGTWIVVTPNGSGGSSLIGCVEPPKKEVLETIDGWFELHHALSYGVFPMNQSGQVNITKICIPYLGAVDPDMTTNFRIDSTCVITFFEDMPKDTRAMFEKQVLTGLQLAQNMRAGASGIVAPR